MQLMDGAIFHPQKTDRIRGAIRGRNASRGGECGDKRMWGRFKPKVSLKSRLTLCKSFLSVFVINFLTCVTWNERERVSVAERGWRRRDIYVVS